MAAGLGPTCALPNGYTRWPTPLWGNSTLGLLCYWWHSSRQQAGRGSMPVTAIRTMPTLDVTKLTPRQLETAAGIFDDMRERTFLPANEAYRDTTRQELDHRVLIEVLELPESAGAAGPAPPQVVLRAECPRGQRAPAPPGAAGRGNFLTPRQHLEGGDERRRVGMRRWPPYGPPAVRGDGLFPPVERAPGEVW